MVTVKDKLENIHFEHEMWVNELSFYLNEIAFYRKHLLRKYKGYPKDGIPTEVLEAWDQAKQQEKMANGLFRMIKKHIHKINQMVGSNGQLARITDSEHPKVRLQMAVFRKDYVAWKEMFHQLLEKQRE